MPAKSLIPRLLLVSSLLPIPATLFADEKRCQADATSATGWRCETLDGETTTATETLNPAVVETDAVVSDIVKTQADEQPPAISPIPAVVAPAKADAQPSQKRRTGHCGNAESINSDITTRKGLQTPTAETPITASAGSIEKQGDTITLSGNIDIERGDLALHASEATLDKETGTVTLQGGVSIAQKTLLIRGGNATIDTSDSTGEVNNAQFMESKTGIRGSAERIERANVEEMTLSGGYYTSCPVNRETWHLAASEINLNQKTGDGTAKHARLVMGKVPIVYLPYITFPIDDRRRSGLLTPSLGTADQGNLDYSQPYYLNLGRNHDATLTPRYIANNGVMTELQSRYLGSSGSWNMDASFLPEDRYNKRLPDINGIPQFNEVEDDRWRIVARQDAEFSSRWRTFIDYTEVSDNEFLDDFYSSSIELRRAGHLNQQGSVEYISKDWQLSLDMQQFQTVDLDLNAQYKTLPQLTVNRQITSHNFEPNYLFAAELTQFDHINAKEDGGDLDTGQRYYAEAGVNFPMRWAAGHLKPTAKIRHVSYFLDTPQGSSDSLETSVNVPLFSLDSGLFFERSLIAKGTRYRQTLEPRIFYLYSGQQEQDRQPIFDTRTLTFGYNQLFRETRFTGHDRISDANQLTYAFTSRLYHDTSQRELGSLRVGQIAYFKDRKVSAGDQINEDLIRKRSDIATEFTWLPYENLRIDTSIVLSKDFEATNLAGLGVHYENDNGLLLDFNYRFRRDVTSLVNTTRLQQVGFGAAVPIDHRWKLFSSWRYDLTGHRSIEDLVGVEYQDCCWSIRLLYNRQLERVDDINEANASSLDNLDRDNAVHLEFEFKGLGSIGRRTALLLEQSIFGYEED